MALFRPFVASMMVLVAQWMVAQYPDWAKGLCGEGLKEAVRVNCSPSSVVENVDLWDALQRIDAGPNGTVINRFDDRNPITYVTLSDKSWWMADYGRLPMLGRDMHQLYPCGDGVAGDKKDYMPGVPVDTLVNNGSWQVGKDHYGQGVWSFPMGCEGEMARGMLYVACIYPSDLFVGNGAVFMEAGDYPSLSKTALDYLIGLHNRYAPDEREKVRTEAISDVQGNVNPFVVWPELVNHIWGEYKDIPVGGCEGEDVPDLKPLKGYYTLEDATVDLYSPFVPEDAEWVLDGQKVAERRIAVAALEGGDHELEFRSPLRRGKLVIRISK